MRKIRDVLRYRHSTGLSLEAIARALSISKGVVAKYLRLASDAGLGWPLPEDLDDAALEKRLYQQPSARISDFAEPDYAQVHQELKRKGVTLTLLWEEYRHEVGDIAYQYTAFCTRYRVWVGKLKRSMRQTHRGGEKLFVDYAGPSVPIIDAETGEIRPASIFVAVLGASSYTFACATPGQTQADWLTGLGRALIYIGAVTELIVPDCRVRDPGVGFLAVPRQRACSSFLSEERSDEYWCYIQWLCCATLVYASSRRKTPRH